MVKQLELRVRASVVDFNGEDCGWNEPQARTVLRRRYDGDISKCVALVAATRGTSAADECVAR